MAKLALSDIADLRAYERDREEFRRSVIALKRLRRVSIGPLLTVVFENATTMRFQIQEMARVERMVSDEQILGELDVYNALIPDPGELSMTLFLELANEDDLREWLPKLVGIEQSLAVRIDGAPERLVRASVDPGHAAQLTRDEVTASVHYVKIVLDEAAQQGFVDAGATLVVVHPAYRYEAPISAATRASLVADWGTGSP